MTERTAKNWLGLFLIGSHLGVVVALLIEFLVGGFSFKDMTTVVGLVTPMFTAYTAVVIKYFTENRHVATDDTPAIATPFIVLMFAIPTLFVLLLVGAILLFGLNIGFGSFEQLKAVLAIIEVAYGFYLVKIVDALFPKPVG